MRKGGPLRGSTATDADFQRHHLYHPSPPSMSGRSFSRAGSTYNSTYAPSTYGGYTDMVNMPQPPASGHSNFARASCAVCGEPLTTSFQGEKVIEPPDCPHVMHEQCYKEFSKDFSNCAICSKPLTMRRSTNGYNKNFGQTFGAQPFGAPSFGIHPTLTNKNNGMLILKVEKGLFPIRA
jgi:hypothetical protein